MTKYIRLESTINNLEVYIKIDEWNGESIKHYPSCTLYNGTIIYLLKDFDKNKKLITKKIFDRKYLSINPIMLEFDITENEWEKVINDL